jgi:PhnB protein
MSKPTNIETGLAPYLAVKNAAQAVEFYQSVLGAKEAFRLTNPEGKVCHSELHFGDSAIMLSEEFPGYSKSPETLGGTPVRLCLNVTDVEATVDRAAKAGATITMPPSDQFYGYHSAAIRDPFGHEWMIQRQIEKVEPAEMQRRFDEMCKNPSCPSK